MNTSTQNALPGTAVPHVGTYRRRMNVSLERMYENTLDWEHLPYVHQSSFSQIRCLDAGRWGWRAALVDARGRESVIELKLDRASRRWITRNIEGGAKGSEIWTHVFELGEREIEVIVDFFVPDIADENRDKVGAVYASAYHQLYEEDEAMMRSRQYELDQRIQPINETQMQLPPRTELELPHRFPLGGRDYVLRECDGELHAHLALCPHQLGPLAEGELKNGEVTCPWHGYRFSLATGERVNMGANGAPVAGGCRLSPAPRVEETSTGVLVTAIQS